MDFDNLRLRRRRHLAPYTPEQIEATVGTDCDICVSDVRNGPPYDYRPYVIVAAEPTDDPYVVKIDVEPKLVFRF